MSDFPYLKTITVPELIEKIERQLEDFDRGMSNDGVPVDACQDMFAIVQRDVAALKGKVAQSADKEQIFRAGFEACLRWPYRDFDEHVKEGLGANEIKDRNFDPGYVADVKAARRAYQESQ